MPSAPDPDDRQLRLDLDRPALDVPLLTPAEAAKLLAVRTSWIYEAARNNQVPHIHLGRHLRFIRRDLDLWIRRQRAA